MIWNAADVCWGPWLKNADLAVLSAVALSRLVSSL